MAFEDLTSESHHHAHAYMENILPASISKLERPLQTTPKMERSMTESFMLDHSQAPDLSESQLSIPPVNDEEALTPISNWVHLSFIKNQRNTLRSELKAQQVASAEARASIAALRRLAFRLAVNISVKEKQITVAAKSLAGSRKEGYVSSRNAEKRIEALKQSLKEEERRNREILEALERASKLTLQCMCAFLALGSVLTIPTQTPPPANSLEIVPSSVP